MKPSLPSVRSTARHEAAHVLVAYLLGIPLEAVRVRPKRITQDGQEFISLGCTDHTAEEKASVNRLLTSEDPLEAEGADLLRRHMHSACAGVVAEMSLRETSEEATESDRREMFLHSMRLAGGTMSVSRVSGRATPGDYDEALAHSERVAALGVVEGILAKHEADWDALTVRLARDGRMSGEAIDRFLSERGLTVRYEVGPPPATSTGDEEAAKP